MGGILVVGELVAGGPGAGQPSRLTLELATLAARLAADAAGNAAGDAAGGAAGNADGAAAVLLAGATPAAADAVAAHGSTVLVTGPPAGDAPVAAALAVIAAALIEQRDPELLLIGASPDGEDVAGLLVGLTDLPILVAAQAVEQGDGGVVVHMGTFGGRVLTTSAFATGRGIVLVIPGAIPPLPAARPGPVERVEVSTTIALPAVSVIDRVRQPATGPSIDDARVIVSAGRGVAGAAGVALVAGLAEALGGAVGATRAAVDAGWLDFAQQIGQTGKTVKPDLYVAVGVSGAIQHRVGVQSAGTIVAINQDADAPIAEFADILVIGDLFQLVPLLTAALRGTSASR